jgi:hypothetical protein
MLNLVVALAGVVMAGGYFWLIALAIVGLIRVLRRMGYSGYWALLAFVPLINAYAIWRLSKAKWPAIPSA